MSANAAAQAEAVQTRHLEIGDEQIGQRLLDFFPGLQAVVGAAHVEAGAAQLELGGSQDRDVVVAKKDGMRHGFSREWSIRSDLTRSNQLRRRGQRDGKHASLAQIALNRQPAAMHVFDDVLGERQAQGRFRLPCDDLFGRDRIARTP